jgi:hypothetical protein
MESFRRRAGENRKEKPMKKKVCVLIMVLTTLAVLAADKKQSPFACDRLALSPAERTRHFDELGPALLKLKTGVRELPDGYEFKFPSDKKTFAMLSEFIEQERRCCPFFDITLHVESEGGPLSMRVTGRPGTKEFIQADAGAWIKQ